MGMMKPLKRSVAVIVGRPDGAFLVVRRPDDPDDPLAGAWGLPAITLLDGEDERAGVVRAGRVKLGVELAAGARIGEKAIRYGADGFGPSLYFFDPEGNMVELKGPPQSSGEPSA